MGLNLDLRCSSRREEALVSAEAGLKSSLLTPAATMKTIFKTRWLEYQSFNAPACLVHPDAVRSNVRG
jgi:hypothetical protein